MQKINDRLFLGRWSLQKCDRMRMKLVLKRTSAYSLPRGTSGGSCGRGVFRHFSIVVWMTKYPLDRTLNVVVCFLESFNAFLFRHPHAEEHGEAIGAGGEGRGRGRGSTSTEKNISRKRRKLRNLMQKYGQSKIITRAEQRGRRSPRPRCAPEPSSWPPPRRRFWCGKPPSCSRSRRSPWPTVGPQ